MISNKIDNHELSTLVLTHVKDIAEENQCLLNELEVAYKNMELILQQSDQEKEIAYQELQRKFHALERLYTELTNKENMLIHLEKLSSIGQFVTEIIHEFQSPLTAIKSYADLALMSDLSEEVREFTNQITKNVMRMSGLLMRFSEMVYKTEEYYCLFDIQENLTECLATIEIIKPKDIEIITSFCCKKLAVKGDPQQIIQIFLNLAKNAFEAMELQGNTLRVSTKRITAEWIKKSDEIGRTYCQDENTWKKILQNSDNFALVEFADEGTGIPSECLENIFQAFYSTKERDKGRGLGLSISSDIAKRHHGNITVKSVFGKGTTFQFLIPLETDSLS